MAYLVIAFFFGLGAGVVGRIKGSSFFIWFLVGAVFPILGLAAAVLYRYDSDEPERECERCGNVCKLHDAICTRCGAELAFPHDSAARPPVTTA